MKRSPMPKRKKPMRKLSKRKQPAAYIVFSKALKDANYEIGFNLGGPSPLKRSKKRMARLRPGKVKARREFREAVMAKKGGLCVKCLWDAGWLTPLMAYDNPNAVIRIAEHPHHWLPVGRQGTDDPSNGIPLCSECHRWIHDNPKLAYETGWLLKANEAPNANAVKIREWLENRG